MSMSCFFCNEEAAVINKTSDIKIGSVISDQ